MKLLPVFIQVAGELGIGSALFMVVQRTGEIRVSFFSFMCWLSAICFFLMSLALEGARLYTSPYFPCAVFAALAAYQCMGERVGYGKKLLLFSAVLAGIFLFRSTWLGNSRTGSPLLDVLNLAAGTLLFGWSNGAMILGHWYLIMRGLSFSHFQRATTQLLSALGLRTILFAVSSYYIFRVVGLMNGHSPDMLFFFMRILWGFLVPAAFCFMAWRCALIGSNQAGTGLLYIAEVAILIGEILAGFFGM